MARFTLSGIWASGPTYKVGLLLALTGADYDYVHVDLRAGAHKQPEYLAQNPFGVVPTLKDNLTGEVYRQSGAIMETVAELTGKFIGVTPAERRHAREFVFWGWDRLSRGIYRPRGARLGFAKMLEEVVNHYGEEGRSALGVLDGFLLGREWLVGTGPTFADIDIFGVVAFADQAGISVADYPHVLAWTKRIEALPGYAGPEALLPKA